MSVPTAELTAPAATAPEGAPAARFARALGPARLYLVIAGAALAIAAFSLLIPSTPSYDPWAWLVWGREILHLDLHTPGGPSWKPLPVIFTTIFSPLHSAQPDLWLVISRAGAIVAFAMVFRVAWRLTRMLGSGDSESMATAGAVAYMAPLLAAVIAAGSLVNSGGFISDNALGYSEGLTTALLLVAVDCYLDGNLRAAFAVAFFAALDRPELWVFWGPYGLYLFWRDPGARRLVISLFVLIPVLWFLPELWGSGHLLRGVTRAQHPRRNSAAFTSCPICTVFKKEAWPAVLNRVKIPGIIGMVAAAIALWRTRAAWWRRGPVERPTIAKAWLLGLGVFGFLWWFGIALETQAGFSGNNRYLVFGTAPVAIAGGMSWGWFAQSIGRLARELSARAAAARRLASPGLSGSAGVVVAAALFLAVPPWIGTNIISLPRTHRALVYQAHLREDMAASIRRLGGTAAVLRCGSVMAEGFQVPMLAWMLDVRTLRVEAQPTGIAGPPWPNIIFQDRDTSHAALLPVPAQIRAWERDGARYAAFHQRTFRVFSTCPTRVAG